MKDRMERFVVLPFSMRCVSQASVDVVDQDRPRRMKLGLKLPSQGNEEDEDEDNMKHSSRFLTLPKPNLSTGVVKLVKGFKSLSQMFIYEDEMEELGMEMQIGGPTDVKHVTHIGWDGTTAANLSDDNNAIIEWRHLFTPELLSDHPPAHPSPASSHQAGMWAPSEERGPPFPVASAKRVSWLETGM